MKSSITSWVEYRKFIDVSPANKSNFWAPPVIKQATPRIGHKKGSNDRICMIGKLATITWQTSLIHGDNSSLQINDCNLPHQITIPGADSTPPYYTYHLLNLLAMNHVVIHWPRSTAVTGSLLQERCSWRPLFRPGMSWPISSPNRMYSLVNYDRPYKKLLFWTCWTNNYEKSPCSICSMAIFNSESLVITCHYQRVSKIDSTLEAWPNTQLSAALSRSLMDSTADLGISARTLPPKTLNWWST